MRKDLPWITRWGSTIILTILISIIIGCFFVRFPQIVRTSIVIVASDSSLTGTILIPSNDISKIKTEQEVIVYLTVLSSSKYDILTGYVASVSNNPHKYECGSYAYRVDAAFKNINADLLKYLLEFQKVEGRAEIVIDLNSANCPKS